MGRRQEGKGAATSGGRDSRSETHGSTKFPRTVSRTATGTVQCPALPSVFLRCDSCNVWPAATRRRRGAARQDKVGQSTSKPENLAKSGFSPQQRSQPEHGLGLQVLMNNDINSSVESLNSACNMQSDTDTAPLLEDGQHASNQGAASSSRGQPQASPRQKMQRSQPVHILRRLQEEDQQLRTASLPAIPNPFPELTGAAPGSPPSVAPSSLPPPPSQPPAKHCGRCEKWIPGENTRGNGKRKIWRWQFPPGFQLSKLTRPGLWTKTTARFSKKQPKNQCPTDTVNPVARMPTSQMEKLRLRKDVKVFSEDGTSKVVEILTDMTARDLCQLLVYKSHCVDDNSWTLVEHHPQLGLERCLEDHEIVVQVESTMPSESKFLFRKNYAKYEFFKNPVNFFPDQMVNWCQQSNGGQAQLLQNFLNTSSCPEIQGFLQVKEVGRKSWKKLYVCLRRSGLYYSTKGTSKEPRHLQLLADLEESSIFYLIAGKKQYNAPNEHGMCIKPNKAKTFFTLDDGNTKFSDLIQLVDFYQLNKGVLPCKLKHHCIRVAL